MGNDLSNSSMQGRNRHRHSVSRSRCRCASSACCQGRHARTCSNAAAQRDIVCVCVYAWLRAYSITSHLLRAPAVCSVSGRSLRLDSFPPPSETFRSVVTSEAHVKFSRDLIQYRLHVLQWRTVTRCRMINTCTIRHGELFPSFFFEDLAKLLTRCISSMSRASRLHFTSSLFCSAVFYNLSVQAGGGNTFSDYSTKVTNFITGTANVAAISHNWNPND